MKKEAIKSILKTDILSFFEPSDVILRSGIFGYKFKNLETGKISEKYSDVIRDNKKYIILSDYSTTYGFLAKYMPEYNMLLVVIYVLTTKSGASDDIYTWKEAYRAAVSRNGIEAVLKPVWDCYSNITDAIEDFLRFTKNNAIDLCGQFIGNNKSANNPIPINITGESGKEMRAFSDGVIYIRHTCFMFNYESNLFTLFHNMFYDSSDVRFGILENDMSGIKVGELRIPKPKQEILLKAAECCITSYVKTGSTTDCNFLHYAELGYLQNVNGEYVLRCFNAVIKSLSVTGKLELQYIEVKRIHVTEKILKSLSDLSVPLLYFDRDGIESGVFKHAVKHLEDAEANAAKDLRSITHYYDVMYKYGVGMQYAAAMAFCPLFEKLANLFEKKGISPEFAPHNKLRDMAVYGCRDLNEALEAYVGKCYDKKELHKQLGVSKSLLNYFSDNPYFFDYVRVVKYIFKGEEKYLIDMDENTAKAVFDFMDLCNLRYAENVFVHCLKMMVESFGAKGIRNYINSLFDSYYSNSTSEDEDEEWIFLYEHYLEKVCSLKNRIEGLTWKVKREDLEKADEAITPAYTLFQNEGTYREAFNKFKSQYENWEKYEYCADGFLVTYPKGPCDLIEEGVKLNHCAKTYIDSVANGKTMILFIRDINKPNKPFYTLEIVNGETRQCHGFDNCSIYDSPGVADFLEEFCEENDIYFDKYSIDDLLEVEHDE